MKDFQKLQDFISDAIDKLSSVKRASYIDKEVDTQCIKNFERLLSVIADYMLFQFNNADYVEALHTYKRFYMGVNINIEMLNQRSASKRHN